MQDDPTKQLAKTNESKGFDSAPISPQFGNIPPPMGQPGSQKTFTPKKQSSLPLVIAIIVVGLFGLILGGASVFAICQSTIAQRTAESATSVNKVKAELTQANEFITTLTTDKKRLEAEMYKLIDEVNEFKRKVAYLEMETKKAQVENTHDLRRTTAEPKSTNKLNTPFQKVAGASESAAPTQPNSIKNIGLLELVEDTKAHIQKLDSIDSVLLIENGNLDKPVKLELKDGSWGIKGLALTKLFKVSEVGSLFELQNENGWKAPHDKKIVYIKTGKQDLFYRFCMSNTMELLGSKTSADSITSSDLPIPDLKPSDFEIANLSQISVDWNLGFQQTKGRFSGSCFVEAKVDEVSPSYSMQQKRYREKRATLMIKYMKEDSKIAATLTIEDGSSISEAQAKDLKTVVDLSTAMKDNPLNFDLIMKEVELKWDNNRKVDVKVPLKIKFK